MCIRDRASPVQSEQGPESCWRQLPPKRWPGKRGAPCAAHAGEEARHGSGGAQTPRSWAPRGPQGPKG
eukprot:2786104-Alexandrium_andersonii.AAC.1